MKAIKLFLCMAALLGAFTMTSCGDDEAPVVETCTDGIMNQNETGVDCGGVCAACVVTPTCNDGIMNGDETGVDCGGSCDACPAEEVTLGGSIGTMTLDASKIYIIDRFAYVDDGDVLTIPAGTILKAKDGQGADASALIVARGGKIMANGAADNPIIFTSVNDDIQPGETASTIDPTSLSQGQWGGLIILGKAPVSVKPADSADGVGREGFIEGVPSSFSFSRYGGSDASDDSGELSFVSIRYTGSTLSTDEEIQGLTLGGVGSATDIHDIEVYSSFDDGIEIFGGTVDVTNLLVAYQTDDAIDLDQSYDGTIDNAVVLLYNPKPGNDGMEIDGPEASGINDGGFFTVDNVTIYQKGAARMARVKSKAQGTVNNAAFKDFAVVVTVDDNDTPNDTSDDITDFSSQRFLDGGAVDVTVSNSEFNLSETNAVNNDGGALTLTNDVFNVTSFTKGADESKFDWTFSKAEGLF